MTDTEILREMFHANVKVPIKSHYDRLFVTLTEPNEPDSTVSIYGIPEDAVIIKADAFSVASFFSGHKGECKRADYIFISEEKKVVLFLEMKRTKDSWQTIVRQLVGARCLFYYCCEIGQHFWNNNNFLKDYRFRFISIGHTSMPKRKMRVERKSGCHNTPEHAMKIDWPSYLEFNKLTG